MKVQELMTQHPVCCRPTDTANMVAEILRDEDIGSIPVVSEGDSGRLVGIITDRDLCCRILAAGIPLSPKRTRQPRSKPPNRGSLEPTLARS